MVFADFFFADFLDTVFVVTGLLRPSVHVFEVFFMPVANVINLTSVV